jgi:cytochrome d ubiquinol oxidase subunit II
MAAGGAALVLLRRGSPRLLRALAGLAVAALVVGWGTAQYPYLLGTHASLTEVAAPQSSLVAVTVVFVVAIALVVPSLTLLYVLQQRGRLDAE